MSTAIATATPKDTFVAAAKTYGVTANYSGGQNTMFISGDDSRVKSFIRIRNLMGKAAHDYAIKQSKL